MKTYKWALSIIVTGFLISSCSNKFLEVTPLNQLSDKTFWKTKNDADLALAGCYRNWEGFCNIVFGDCMSDNGFDQFNYGYQIIGNGTLTPTNLSNGFYWDSQAHNWFTYSRIRKYNDFLHNIATVQIDTEEKKQYIAQVRFLRAYNYFNKVMLYGDVPLITTLIPPSAHPDRDPAEKVEQFILNELDTVSTVLPVENCIASKGHITAGAALALKSRLELYMGKYEDAMKDAKAVIDEGVYHLYPDYRGLFLPENESQNEEAILEIEYMPDDYKNALPQLNLPARDGGWSSLDATKSIVDYYEMNNGKPIEDHSSGYDPDNPYANRDPRLAMTILYPGQKWDGRIYDPYSETLPNGDNNPDYYRNAGSASHGGYIVKKYIEPVSAGNLQNYGVNIMVIRLAEMYLTYAECALETKTNETQGLRYLNLVRTRAGMPPDKELTEENVRYERRTELAFEGLRYFDIKRWDLGPGVLDGAIYGCPHGSVDPNTGKLTVETGFIKLEERHFSSSRKYLLPIPQAELDANPNMTQTPGY